MVLLLGSEGTYSEPGTWNSEQPWAIQFTASKSGTVEAIKFLTNSTANTGVTKVVLGIFADKSGTEPGAWLGEATYTGTPGTNEWIEAKGLSVAVVAGTKYWLAFVSLGAELHSNFGTTGSAAEGNSPVTTLKADEGDWPNKYSAGPIAIAALGTESASGVELPLASASAASSTSLALHAPVGVSPAIAQANGATLLALGAPTGVRVSGASIASTGSLGLGAPAGLPVSAASGASSGSLSLSTTTASSVKIVAATPHLYALPNKAESLKFGVVSPSVTALTTGEATTAWFTKALSKAQAEAFGEGTAALTALEALELIAEQQKGTTENDIYELYLSVETSTGKKYNLWPASVVEAIYRTGKSSGTPSEVLKREVPEPETTGLSSKYLSLSESGNKVKVKLAVPKALKEELETGSGIELPVKAASGTSTGSLSLAALTGISPTVAAANSGALLALGAPAGVQTGSASGSSTGTLGLQAPAGIALAAAAGSSNTSLALGAATGIVPSSASGTSSGSFTLSLPAPEEEEPPVIEEGGVELPLGSATAASAASLALRALTGVSLASASGNSSTLLALNAPAGIVPSATSATSSTSMGLTAAPQIIVGTASATSAGGLTLSIAGHAELPLNPASASSATILGLGAPTNVSPGSATGSSSAALGLNTPTGVSPVSALATSSTSLALHAATGIITSTASAASTTQLGLHAPAGIVTSAATGSSTTQLTLHTTSNGIELSLGSTTASSTGTLGLHTPTGILVAPANANSTTGLVLGTPIRVAPISATSSSHAQLELVVPAVIPLQVVSVASTGQLALTVTIVILAPVRLELVSYRAANLRTMSAKAARLLLTNQAVQEGS